MRTGLVLVLVACGGSDPVPITVVDVTPPDRASSVALDTAITLELSEPPPADFAFTLIAETGEPVPHAMTVDGTTVTLTPESPLWLATSYAVGGDDFTSSFKTRDGTWRHVALHSETMMTAAPLGSGAAPSLATLPDGTVFAGWEGGSLLFDSKFTPSAGWLAMPNRLAVTGDPDSVDVAAASASRAVAVHARYIGTRPNIEARIYDGTQWTAPALVAPYQVGTTRHDQFLAGGAATPTTFAALWHRGDFDTERFELYASLHDGSAWSPPIAIDKTAGTVWAADIIDDGRGGYVIAWTRKTPDKLSTSVWVATLSSTGTLGTPQMLDDGAGTTYALSLARGGDTVWIAWMHQQGTTGLRAVARPLRPSGLGPAKQIDLDGYSFGGEWARIAASAHGALLAYTQYGGVFATVSSGDAWSPVVEVDKVTVDSDAGCPAPALDDRGNATIVWTRVPRTGRRTTMVSRGRAGSFSPPVQLDEGTRSTYAWAAGVDAAGRVTTAWTQSDAAGYTVWGAHLQ